MNKKLACILISVALLASATWAQNLLDNDYQKAGREFEKQATAAMDAGDYAKAAELANLATEQYRLSREAAEAQTLKFRAANAINLAQQMINDVSNGPKRKTNAKDIANATALLAEARKLYTAENWVDSRTKALASLDAIKGLTGGETVIADTSAMSGKGLVLPRYYKVVSRPSATDCFWRIAAMPAIYGNPHLWQKLWMANKGKLRDPENPNLLHPGTILEIPPVKGETREGTFDPAKKYPALEQ